MQHLVAGRPVEPQAVIPSSAVFCEDLETHLHQHGEKIPSATTVSEWRHTVFEPYTQYVVVEVPALDTLVRSAPGNKQLVSHFGGVTVVTILVLHMQIAVMVDIQCLIMAFEQILCV